MSVKYFDWDDATNAKLLAEGGVGSEGGVFHVEDEHTAFLTTIIPSRKATKQYLGEESDDET
jgi:hypothetical protein